MSSLQEKLKALGPGLLFAGTAIGVSHIYQSTKAGAEYGPFLIWAILLANLLKYPFFEFGPRYAVHTGESLIRGYRKMGIWVLLLFVLVSVLTVFTVMAAVSAVTSALALHIFGSSLELWQGAGITLLLCAGILAVGRYQLLDRSIKVIIITLSIATLAALASSTGATEIERPFTKNFDWSDGVAISFLIALMGWMPAPIDLSVWHSLWVIEKKKTVDINPQTCLFDFRLGYIGTAILALCFLGLGSQVLFGTMEQFPAKAGAFAVTLVDVYRNSLGPWARNFIAIAALATMFSTTLTCFDAIPRVLKASFEELRQAGSSGSGMGGAYWIILAVLATGALLIISVFVDQLDDLILLANILSFLTAPFFAIANFALIRGKHSPDSAKPGKLLVWTSYLGICFLTGFGIWYISTLI
jgi:Mn2+/Fe2+ NRAMP family transporter